MASAAVSGVPPRQAAAGKAAVPVDTAAAVKVLLERPLFAPGRRPPTVQSLLQSPEAPPRLSGIIRAPGLTLAIFQPQDPAKPVAARQGERVADWLVTAVQPDGVLLTRAGQELALKLGFAANVTVTALPPRLVSLLGTKHTDSHLAP